MNKLIAVLISGLVAGSAFAQAPASTTTKVAPVVSTAAVKADAKEVKAIAKADATEVKTVAKADVKK